MPSIGQLLLTECNKNNLHFQMSLTTTILRLLKFLDRNWINPLKSNYISVCYFKNIFVKVISHAEKLLFQE